MRRAARTALLLLAPLAGCARPPAPASAPLPLAAALPPAPGGLSGTVVALRTPAPGDSAAVLAVLGDRFSPAAGREAIIAADDGRTLSVIVPAASGLRAAERVTLTDGPAGIVLGTP